MDATVLFGGLNLVVAAICGDDGSGLVNRCGERKKDGRVSGFGRGV